MVKKIAFSLLILFMLVPLAVVQAKPQQASSVTAADLISLVNSIRTANGLPALVENAILDGTAQWTAQYMADNNLNAHIGNVAGRIQSAGYGNGSTVFATENWAGGNGGLTIETIAAYWSDASHMIPMTNSSYQNIGAGVATSADGRVIYIVHAAYIAGGQAAATRDPRTPSSAVVNTPGVSQVMMPVVTSTPNPDGSVIHDVQAGQSLWSIAIAYGGEAHTLHVADILTYSGLPTNAVIWVGQQLVIQPSYTPTIESTPPTATHQPTRTATQTPEPRTPTPSPTPTISPTPTLKPLISGFTGFDRRTLGIVIIAICGLGLGVVVVGSLRKKG